MLLEFSVANYRSFKEKKTLSLLASSGRGGKDSQAHPENTFAVPGRPDIALLKSAAIYGANASGKSNLIKALEFMKRFVLTSTETNNQLGTALSPFKLDPATVDNPSEFEIVFMLEEKRYVYGFTVDRERVHEEWLTVSEKGTRERTSQLFTRQRDQTIRFNEKLWRGEKKKLEERTRPDALFLSVGAQWNHPLLSIISSWFRDTLMPVFTKDPNVSLKVATFQWLETNPEYANLLTNFIQFADRNIQGLNPKRRSVSLGEIPEESLLELRIKMPKGAEDVQYWAATLESTHLRSDGLPVPFNFFLEESAGTQTLFGFAPYWLQMRELGGILVFDELDTHLHPMLMRFLVERIHRAPNTQLIFTTHDCSLLDAELFRRDQIWFTEKDAAGATDLYSLWDFKEPGGRARVEENFRTGYLKGRYGAIPFVGELNFG
ncbi:MAG TPA: ATP-binding protein [Armatimonadota bacterium]|jgi:hypothetical protein